MGKTKRPQETIPTTFSAESKNPTGSKSRGQEEFVHGCETYSDQVNITCLAQDTLLLRSRGVLPRAYDIL
jgi:hypothetical protein